MARGQQVPLYDRTVEAVEDAEDAVLRLIRRDGVIDHEEEAVITIVRRAVISADRSAHAARTGLALIRCGEESPRVIRLRRDCIGSPPENPDQVA